MGLVPPRLDLAFGGQGGHFVKSLIEEPDVSGVNDRAFQDGSVHKHHVGIDDRGAFEVLKDLVFNDQSALFAYAFSKPAKCRGVQKGHEALIRDIAKVLHVSVFLNVFDDLAVAELSESGQDRGGNQEAQGVARATFLRVIEGDEAVNNGLPRNDVAQDDQIVGRIGQMRFDPLGRERVLKCLCYHGMDLCVGCE